MARTYTTPGRKIPADQGWAELRDARQNIGYTQQEMADALGVPKRTLQDWELGRNHPNAFTVSAVRRKVCEIVKKAPPRSFPTEKPMKHKALSCWASIIKDWDFNTPITQDKIEGNTLRTLKREAWKWAEQQPYGTGILVLHETNEGPVNSGGNILAWRKLGRGSTVGWKDAD